MAVVDNAAGITIDSSGQHMNSKLLDGLPAASATGQAVRYDEAVVTAGTHAFTAVQSGVSPTAAAHLATRSWVDQSMVVVWGATTAALPAYTASGTGPGKTLTANANGAFPTIDGYVTFTANDPLKGLILLHNGASAVDNGIYMLTTQGSGGSAWVLTRYAGMDTAATIAGGKIRVANGLQKRGAEYCYVAQAAITMETTKLYWKRVDARIGPNEGTRAYDDCREAIIGANLYNPYFIRYQSGTGATVTVATSGNSATLQGELIVASGTLATNKGGLIGGWTSAFTQPDDGNVFVPGATVGFDLEARIQAPVLSTAAQEFAINFGWTKQINNSQKTPADAIVFIYDRTSAVSSTNWLCSLSNGGTGTPVDSGITVNAAQYYHLRIVQDPGDANTRFYIDGALVSTQSTNTPTGTVLGYCCMGFKSVGTVSTNILKIDFVGQETDTPEMRVA